MTTEPLAPGSAELIALIRQTAAPLDREQVPLAHALGRVLRAPVRAAEDQPPFDRSAVDGFAVRVGDDSAVFRLVDEIRAGDWKPRQLQTGETVRIATGGALPSAGLQVLMKEHIEATATTVRVLRPSTERHVRIRGEDAASGQLLLDAPLRLNAGALALLASLGCAQPEVTRQPRVVHLATGNEIVPPETTPDPGQIRDSNSTLVRAFLQSLGITPRQHRVAEDHAALETALRTSADTADLLLISGGASVGPHDFTRVLLEQNGFDILVSKTSLRPGKPLIFARRGTTLAFGLPGNPLAHFVCLHLFVRAALEQFAGLPPAPLWRRGVLAADFSADIGPRETFWPAFCRNDDGGPALLPLAWNNSGDLTSLATANALLRFAGHAPARARGDGIEFCPV